MLRRSSGLRVRGGLRRGFGSKFSRSRRKGESKADVCSLDNVGTAPRPCVDGVEFELKVGVGLG
jgi:hypothetical protein